MRPLLLLLPCLPAACVVLPDEVSVSGMQSDYDYLGGDDLKGLGSENGASTGVMVTATYKLKPQQVQLVGGAPGTTWNRPQRLLDQTADRLAETADRRLAETADRLVDQTAETADRLLGQTAEAVFRRVEQTAETAMQTAADNAGYLVLKSLLRPLLFVGGAIVVALVLLVLLFRRCK
jgi:hypothetical protein